MEPTDIPLYGYVQVLRVINTAGNTMAKLSEGGAISENCWFWQEDMKVKMSNLFE